MPIYEYDCPECGRWEYWTHLYDPADDRLCPECGVPSELAVSVPSIDPDEYWAGKYDYTTGKVFTSQSRMKDYLKRNNIGEPITSRDARRAKEHRRAVQDVKREKALADTVKDFVI